jgi:anthranilate/para-aminobenzoate synthase component II
MSTNRIIIVNFEDSFTYNIANVIYPFFKNVSVVEFDIFFSDNFFNMLFAEKSKVGIILGPGPGHPKSYKKFIKLINKLKMENNFFILGICLGHQLLCMSENLQIIAASNLIHGESEEIVYKEEVLKVQRYNSLVPKSRGLKIEELILYNQEVYILRSKNVLSFQFHPESIGTEKNVVFFTELLGFVAG